MEHEGVLPLQSPLEEGSGVSALLLVPVGEERDQDIGIDEDLFHKPLRPMSSRARRTSSTGSPGPTLMLPSLCRKAGRAAVTRTWSPTSSHCKTSLGPTPSFSRTSLGTVV